MSEPTPAEVARMEADLREQAELYKEQRAESERQAERQERQDALVFADAQGGNVLGEMSRSRSALAEAQDELAEADDRQAKAKRRVERARANHDFWVQRYQTVNEAVSRSAPRDPAGAALERARDEYQKHQAFKRNTEAAMRAAAKPSGRRRPFTAGDLASSNGQHPRQGNTKRLTDYGFDEPTPDGCPPCDRCHYVWCRCGDIGAASATARSTTAGGYEVTRGVEAAMVSVR